MYVGSHTYTLMLYVKKNFILLASILFFLFQTSCKETGVQGGSINGKFDGINTIRAISPNAVKIEWNNDSALYEKYKIYLYFDISGWTLIIKGN